MFLSKDDFLKMSLKTKDIIIPDYGTVRIRQLVGRQRDTFEFEAAKGKRMNDDYRNMRAKLVANSVVNEDGSLMFTESEVNTINDKLPAGVLDLLFTAILDFNGMSQEASEAIEKNSLKGQSD